MTAPSPAVPGESVARLRQAAAQMRALAEAMTAEIASGHYYWREQDYATGVRSGLGGAAGDHASSWTPTAASAAADLIEAVLDMDEYVSCKDHPCDYGPCRVIRAAHSLADAFLASL